MKNSVKKGKKLKKPSKIVHRRQNGLKKSCLWKLRYKKRGRISKAQRNQLKRMVTSKEWVKSERVKKKICEQKWIHLAAQRLLTSRVMSNHLISDKIFAHLALKDLLQSSLVCKTWVDNARRVLRREKVCLAKMPASCPHGMTRKDYFTELKSLMKKSTAIPFNDLILDHTCPYQVSWSGHKDCETQVGALESILEIPQFSIRFLKFGQFHVNKKNCPVYQSLGKMFKNVEKLVGNYAEMIPHLVSHNCGDRLVKQLTVKTWQAGILNILLPQKPQLDTLVLDTAVNKLLNRRETLIKLFDCWQNSLKILTIAYPAFLIFADPDLLPIVFTALKEIRLKSPPPIYAQLSSNSMMPLTGIHFDTKFPNLTTFMVGCACDEVVVVPDFLQTLQLQQYKGINVQKFQVNLHDTAIGPNISRFTEIFPNVCHLSLSGWTNFPHNLYRLWTAWSDVESITMKFLDSTFTGIHTNVCKMMKERQDFYPFRRIKTSITNLKELKLLTLLFPEAVPRYEIIGEVTQKCALLQMPWLRVEIGRLGDPSVSF